MLAEISMITDQGSNNGKIALKMADNDPGAAPGYTVKWGVIGPLGTVRDIGSDAGTAFANNGTVTVYEDIPLDSSGAYLAGAYTFAWTVVDDTAEVFIEGTHTFDYSPAVGPSENGAATLVASYNCLSGKINVADATVLGDYTLETRTISVLPPQVAGQPLPVAQVTNDPTLELDIEWNNAPYQVSLTIVRKLTITEDDTTFIVLEQFTANKTLNIVCDTSMCSAAACLEKEITALDALACSKGDWSDLTPAEKAKAERSVYYGVLALLYRNCGDMNKAAEYGAKAGDCGCGCSSADATTTPGPSPYTPPIQ